MGRGLTVIEVVFFWMLATLVLGAGSALLGKKYGVEVTVGAFACLVVIANVIAGKIVVFGPFTVPAAVLVYATTFLVTDILSEKWGKKQARKAVIAGFYGNIILVVAVYIALNWQVAGFSPVSQEDFTAVLGFAPRIVFASMLAYLVSQFHDVWAFHFWKARTGGRHLWLRNNASTLVSQAFDTVIFITVAFYGVVPAGVLKGMLVGQYVVKLLIAAVDTPFIYLTCWLMDRT